MIRPAVEAACPGGAASATGGPAAGGLLAERLIPLNYVATMLARPDGRRPSRLSLWRWATKGVRPVGSPPGRRLRLETLRLGGTRYTSIEAVERFAAALDGPRASTAIAGPSPRPLRARRRQAAEAAARLRAAGFM